MLARYEAVSYQYLRPEEVKRIRDECPIAYIPAGSLEWHSFQNPLGTDGLKAHAVCSEAARAHGGVVLPTHFRGLLGEGNWGPEGWQGFTQGFNTMEAFEATILGTARALVAAGWKVLVGVTGHDVAPQRDAMGRAIDEATKGSAAAGFALMEGELHEPDDEVPLRMDHAGAWETSCMLYAAPGSVRLGALEERKLSSDEHLEMSGPEGIGGKNPLKYASAEMGRMIVTRMGDLIGAKAKALLAETEGR